MSIDTLIADTLSDIIPVDPIKKPLFIKACSAILNDKPKELQELSSMLITMNLTEEVKKFASEFSKYQEPEYALQSEKLLPLSMLKESGEDFNKNYTKLPPQKREEAAKVLSAKGADKGLPVKVYSKSKSIVLSPSAPIKIAECAYRTGNLRVKKAYLALSKMAAATTTMETGLKLAHILEDLNRFSKVQTNALGCIFEEVLPIQKKAAATEVKLSKKNIPITELTQEKVASILGADIASGLFKEGQLDASIFETLPLSDKILLEKYF